MTSSSLSQRLARLGGRPNRFLLRELARANLKASHQNSLLGLAWTLLGPGITLGVLYLVLNSHFGAEIDAYPVFLLLGIVTVGFFTGATQQLTTFFIRRRQLMQNSRVPVETAVVAYLAPNTLKLLIEVGLCVLLAAWWGSVRPIGVLLLLPLVSALWILCVGVGAIVGIGCVVARDVEQIWTVLGRLLFFATPVFYRHESLPEIPQFLVYWMNPLTPILVSLRSVLISPAELSVPVYVHAIVNGSLALGLCYGIYLWVESWLVENA